MILIFEKTFLLFLINKYFGEIANAAFRDIFSSVDLAIISTKHFKFLGTKIPGHATQNPIEMPANINNNDLIFLTLNY